MQRYQAARNAGFTLLEVLVALAVFGLLSVVLVQATRLGLKAWSMQSTRLATAEDITGVDAVLRRLISGADPGGIDDMAVFVGGPATMSFTTELPIEAGGSLTRRADVTIGVNAAHKLSLRWTPHLHARWLRPAPHAEEAIMADGVSRLDLAYWRSAPGGGTWLASWTGDAPPALVRIRIVLLGGARQALPDIIAAPMRERPPP